MTFPHWGALMPSLASRSNLVVLIAALAIACGGRGTGTSTPRADRSLITREQILQNGFTNAFEAVESLRSNWLLTRGPDSINNPSEVLVYLDNTRLGGVQTLRTISTNSIQWIRYYDGLTATARWGLDHGQGVIFVSTGS
jgi:hypothetical protein